MKEETKMLHENLEAINQRMENNNRIQEA